jgi:sugar lactone lactonase YvrE
MKKNLLIVSFFVFGFLSLKSQTYNTVSTFAGTGAIGIVDGPVGTAEFQGAYNLCLDPATGTLYVADTHNNAIRRIRNGMVTTLAGNGVQGDVDAQGPNARFFVPSGICFVNGYVYITDNGNNKIKRIDTLGNSITIAGTGIAGYVDGSVVTAKFWNPTSIVSDNAGGFYIADYANHCIRQMSNGMITTFAGVGTVSGDQLGPVSTALFYRPSSICLDGQGKMYVADLLNNKVKVISGGTVSLLAGSGSPSFANGTGAAASFNHPGGVIMDLWGNVIVNDGSNNMIRRITPAGVATTIAGTLIAGLVNGPAASAEFNSPADECIGLSGEIYVGDNMNNVIRKIFVGDDGINEFSSLVELSIFPNPSSDNVTVINPANDHLSEIQILSVDGKLVKDMSVVNSLAEIKIDVADLPQGTYFISAISASEKKYAGKFIRE